MGIALIVVSSFLHLGLTCDRCNYGFKFLNGTDPNGCVPCGCDPRGSLHQFCNPFTGQCECKHGVRGLLCDTCISHFYGLNGSGVCLACDCSLNGSVLGTSCDAVSGQCKCKPHTEGRQCDVCRDGYHSLDRSNSLGCLPCQCELRGTVNGSDVCDKNTGQCTCKHNVQGLRCNRCTVHTYSLSSANATHGCQPCQCDQMGTVPATVCDPASGQCVCQPTRYGRDCGTCKPGWCFQTDLNILLCVYLQGVSGFVSSLYCVGDASEVIAFVVYRDS